MSTPITQDTTGITGAFPNNSPVVAPIQTLDKQIPRKVYGDFRMDTRYEVRQHTLQMPVANSTIIKSVIAVMAQPTWIKIVQWTTETLGDFPKLPAYTSQDPNEVLLFAPITVAGVELTVEGGVKVYRYSGEYVFAIIDPTKLDLVGGNIPVYNFQWSDLTTPKANFIGGIAQKAGSPTP